MRTLAVMVLVACGCANNVYSMSYSPLNKEYASQLDDVHLGMTKKELRKSLHDIVSQGQVAQDGLQIEAMELQHNYWSGVGGQLIHDRMWFYFVDGKLVKWGKPNAWPRPADIIVETRER